MRARRHPDGPRDCPDKLLRCRRAQTRTRASLPTAQPPSALQRHRQLTKLVPTHIQATQVSQMII